jgi:hypothetical protein
MPTRNTARDPVLFMGIHTIRERVRDQGYIDVFFFKKNLKISHFSGIRISYL